MRSCPKKSPFVACGIFFLYLTSLLSAAPYGTDGSVTNYSVGSTFSSPGASADKISPVILAHREAKRRPVDLDTGAHRAALHARGLNGDDLEGETCALYSIRPLSATEQQELAARGVDITPDIWIPPVEGKHPQGFHLARVAYESLDTVRADPRMIRLESAEMRAKPMNDLAINMIKANLVHNGTGILPFNGAGVRVAVADSGLDLNHADFPVPYEAYDLTTGTYPLTWSTIVANTVSAHGTHVTASAVGRGNLSGGKYRGSAPGAELCFYKIGDNVSASASESDMVEAINRAVTVNARVFTMSYGGFSTYLDGSEAAEQAIDVAVAAGVTVFVAAGNDADAKRHDSVFVNPNTTSDSFGFTIDNTQGGTSYRTKESIRVIWRGGTPGSYEISLICTNLVSSKRPAYSETLIARSSSTSVRGTKSVEYELSPNIPAGTSRTYLFQLTNTALVGSPVTVHLYQISGVGTFDSPDSSYTVGHPAVADSAIAVGAWVQRRQWINYTGQTLHYPTFIVNTLAPFSGRGPRIDGVQKPDIVAPGAATISARESVPGLAATPGLIIDNDGLSLDGSGPANYYIMQGTSMACPMAAGVAALMLQGNPDLTPAEIRAALTNTASRASTPDSLVGSGLIDAQAAVRKTTPLSLTVNSAFGGAMPGTLTTNYGAVVSQWITNSPLSQGVGTQQVSVAGNVMGNVFAQNSPTQVTLTLTNNATLNWQWQTQYLLTTDYTGDGAVTGTSGWLPNGGSSLLTASPASYWYLEGWGGDADDGIVSGNTIEVFMDRTRSIMANFAPNLSPLGTPEYWLASYGLTNDTLEAAEQTDYDSDGMLTWEEYVADTDPSDKQSVLAFSSVNAESNGISLTWTGGQLASQYLEASDKLDAVPWISILTNNVLPTAITNTALIPAPTRNRFYRIRAVR